MTHEEHRELLGVEAPGLISALLTWKVATELTPIPFAEVGEISGFKCQETRPSVAVKTTIEANKISSDGTCT